MSLITLGHATLMIKAILAYHITSIITSNAKKYIFFPSITFQIMMNIKVGKKIYKKGNLEKKTFHTDTIQERTANFYLYSCIINKNNHVNDKII